MIKALNGVRPLVGLLILYLFHNVLGLNPFADVPALVIRGHIRRELYNPQSREPEKTFETKVVAYSSNSWWRIIITPLNEDALPIDCARIPDGIRLLPIITNPIKAEPSTAPRMDGAAELFPIAYPPPGYLGLFPAWLAFTQGPELPVINQKQMRRFLDANQQDNPENMGTYSVTYLSERSPFLSRLSVSNNGVMFSSDRKTFKTKGKFAAGYEELLYEVLDRTNILGLLLPMKATLIGRAIGPVALYDRCIDRITLDSANLLGSDEPPQNNLAIMAFDHRFDKSTKKTAVNYVVTNDTWLATTNANLKSLAQLFSGRPAGLESERGYLLFAGVTVLILAPILIALALKHKR